MNDIMILGIVTAAVGLVIAVSGVVTYFERKNAVAKGKWVRTTAAIVGEFSYTERQLPRLSKGYRSQSNPVTYTQARIVYSVDGEFYEKTAFTDEEKEVDIYYNISKPSHFYTAEEYEKHFENNMLFGLVAGCVAGALMIALGVGLICSGADDANDMPILDVSSGQAQFEQKE